MRILVASVVAPHTARDLSWLEHGAALSREAGCPLDYFLAVELDGRGEPHFSAQLARLAELEGTHWTYHLDKAPHSDGYEVVTAERFIRICMGRNLGIARALDTGASHVLFLDADARPPADVLPRLLEVDRPVVFAHTPSYCLNGPRAPGFPSSMDVRVHGDSLACVLVQREVVCRVGFGWDPDEGLSDDPRFWRDVQAAGFGVPLTRHDCLVRHPPLVPLEARGLDRRLRKIHIG
jgi:hypothetical protein